MRFLISFLTVVLVTTVLVGKSSDAARILSISFMSSPSHKIVYEPLLHKLAERGHEVTVVNPILSKVEVKNVKNIQTFDLQEMEKTLNAPNLFEMKESFLVNMLGPFMSPFLFFGGMLDTICRKSFEHPFIQDLIAGKEKFDLILFTPLFNDCLHGLVHHLNTTTVFISQVTVLPWIAASFGNPQPPSFVPYAMLGLGDKMTFVERITNLLGLAFNEVTKSLIFNPKMERLYREFVDPNLPGIKEIERNASLVICNSHISFTPPKPLMPDIIDVGGMHLKPAKPVPKDLDDFFNGAGEHGFILFSMGSGLKAHTMPEKYRKIFLNTFAKLKQRVIWKWETEEMDDVPKNVKLSKWLPQQDVLGHKQLRLFITHGGHGSTTEAIYNGVPLVGIPMFGDQMYNMKRASGLGFALPLEFTELTEEILTEAIEKVLNNPSYRETAQKLSTIYRDQIDHPLDRAVYHVEYVMRHQGARHLRSAARDLSAIEYYSLDVITTLLVALGLILYIDWLILRAIFRKICGKKGGSDASPKKTN